MTIIISYKLNDQVKLVLAEMFAVNSWWDHCGGFVSQTVVVLFLFSKLLPHVQNKGEDYGNNGLVMTLGNVIIRRCNNTDVIRSFRTIHRLSDPSDADFGSAPWFSQL